MRHLKACAMTVAAAFGALALTAAYTAPVLGQTGSGWTTLLDNTKMGEWDRVGESNWRFEDGAVVADKRTGDSPAFLVSKSSYKDFIIHVEFGPVTTPTVASSCAAPTQENYRQVVLRGEHFRPAPGPNLRNRGIVHFAEVNPMPKAGGKWNTFEISAKGRLITVLLNGQKTVELHNGLLVEGPSRFSMARA